MRARVAWILAAMAPVTLTAASCLLFASSVPCRADRHCDDGQRCDLASGSCVLVDLDDGGPGIDEMDAGPVGGAGDGGAVDAGPVDGGADAGSEVDGGPPDGGGLSDDGGSIGTGGDAGADAGEPDAGALGGDGRCGDGVIDDGEACDDGTNDGLPENSNTLSDACRLDCSLPRCGDGVVDLGLSEECDDGALPGGGCDDSCKVVPGYTCFTPFGPAPSFCAPTTKVRSTSGCVGAATCLFDTVSGAPEDGVIVLAEGTYDEALLLDGVSLTLVSEELATIQRSDGSSDATLTIRGQASVMVLGPNLKRFGSNAPVVRVQDASTLRLGSVGCIESDGSGVLVENNAELTVEDSFFIGNSGIGVDALAGSRVVIERTRFAFNAGGAVFASGIETTIRNSQLIFNGTEGVSFAGGVRTTAAGVTFEHNTVLGNAAEAGIASGVHCAVAGTPIFASLFIDNVGADVGASCAATYSIYPGAGGGTNLNAQVSIDGGYVPAPSSVAVDFVPSSSVTRDYRRTPRPRGSGFDVGSIEVP